MNIAVDHRMLNIQVRIEEDGRVAFVLEQSDLQHLLGALWSRTEVPTYVQVVDNSVHHIIAGNRTTACGMWLFGTDRRTVRLPRGSRVCKNCEKVQEKKGA